MALLEIEVDDIVAGVSNAEDDDEGHFPGATKNGRPHDAGAAAHQPRRHRHRWYQVRSPRAVVATVALMLFAMTLSAMVLIIPLARLVEDDLCRRHYGTSAPVDEERCKVDEVQMRLAWLGGCATVINAITGRLYFSKWTDVSIMDRLLTGPWQSWLFHFHGVCLRTGWWHLSSPPMYIALV